MVAYLRRHMWELIGGRVLSYPNGSTASVPRDAIVRRATAPTPPCQLQGEYSLPSAVKQWSGTVYMLVALTAHEILLYVDAHSYSEGSTTQHSSKNLHFAKVAKLSPMCL